MKHWVVNKTNPSWLFLTVPIMDEELSFREKREVVAEFKLIESKIKPPLKGWIMYTKLTNPHIMIMCLKLGGIPYDIGMGVIWFKKELEK